jgi:signal transduction histidine kinase
VVQKSGSDLLELINDILDLSKIESGNFEIEKTNCNLDDIIQDNYDLFKQISIQNNIEFTVKNNLFGKVILATDPFRLSQVIKNLLSNAFKFTKTGQGDSISLYGYPFLKRIHMLRFDLHIY